MAAAIFLRQCGIDAVVVDRRNTRPKRSPFKVGESLPPDAKKMLEQLGVWNAFEAGPHLQCYGNKSFWRSDVASYHDFMSHPVGHGWHIDRVAFEAMLLEKAEGAGAIQVQEIADLSAEFGNEQWNVVLKMQTGESQSLQSNFIIDATGRNSWFARRQGVERLYEQQQLALTVFCKHSDTFEDTMNLVETTEDGWWYSAKIPDDSVAMAFFCKPSPEQRTAWSQDKGFEELLFGAPNTLKRYTEGHFEIASEKKWVDASSSILEKLHGKGWLAIGDAAMSFDPIASHGLMMSMVSARDAAQALKKAIAGDDHALQAYESVLWAAFQGYLKERALLFDG